MLTGLHRLGTDRKIVSDSEGTLCAIELLEEVVSEYEIYGKRVDADIAVIPSTGAHRRRFQNRSRADSTEEQETALLVGSLGNNELAL